MPRKRKGSKALFTVKDNGPAAEGRGRVYCGYIGGHELGNVISTSKAAARRKLLAAARKKLK